MNRFQEAVMFEAAILAILLVCPPEFGEGLNRAKEDLYSERYEAADRYVLTARKACAQDPESYELRTTLLVLRLKRAAENFRGIAKCGDCEELLREFESDYAAARQLVDSALQADPQSERLLFLSARLYLNRVWLNLEVLGKQRESNGPYRKARSQIETVLRQNPRHVRALVASGWINYVIASRSWPTRQLLKAFGVSGSKDVAFENVALAVSIPGGEYEHWEAKFTLKDLLHREKRFSEAALLQEELRMRFPENGTLNGSKK